MCAESYEGLKTWDLRLETADSMCWQCFDCNVPSYLMIVKYNCMIWLKHIKLKYCNLIKRCNTGPYPMLTISRSEWYLCVAPRPPALHYCITPGKPICIQHSKSPNTLQSEHQRSTQAAYHAAPAMCYTPIIVNLLVWGQHNKPRWA